MGSRRHRSGDLGQMQRQGGGIAARQNTPGGDPLSRANGSKDVGRARPLIERCRWACPAPRPSPGYLVLLSDPGLVLHESSAVNGLLVAPPVESKKIQTVWYRGCPASQLLLRHLTCGRVLCGPAP